MLISSIRDPASRRLFGIMGKQKLIKVLLIYDQALIRAGLSALLEKQDGIAVLDEADVYSQQVNADHCPDVILIDIDQPGAADFFRNLPASLKQARILALANAGSTDAPQRAVRLKALGLVLKEQPPEALFTAIEKVCKGEAWFDRSMIAVLLGEISWASGNQGEAERIKMNRLTVREREVVALLGEGLKNKQIAERLFISEATVRHHLTAIFSKLELTDRFELLIYAYQNGLARLPSPGFSR